MRDVVMDCEIDPDVPITVTGYVPAPVVAPVEMVIPIGAADLPGVTGVEGLKMHRAPAGSPPEHDKITAPLNDAPIGWMDKL